MSKRTPEFIQRLEVEGTSIERRAIEADTKHQALELVKALPQHNPERHIYLRDNMIKVFRKELSSDIFVKFAELAHVDTKELLVVSSRARIIANSK